MSGDQQIPGMQEGDQFNPGTEADQLKQMLEELQDVVFEISDISPKKAKVMTFAQNLKRRRMLRPR